MFGAARDRGVESMDFFRLRVLSRSAERRANDSLKGKFPALWTSPRRRSGRGAEMEDMSTSDQLVRDIAADCGRGTEVDVQGFADITFETRSPNASGECNCRVRG